MTIYQTAKKYKNSDPTEEELVKFFKKRDDYLKECANLGIPINDYLDLSPIQFPAKWTVDENNPKLNGRNKLPYPNLVL